MPWRFAHSLCYQVWFYDGVQTALEGRQPRSADDLRVHYSQGVADAYRAGYEAGKRNVERVDEPAEIQVPEPFVQLAHEKAWFILGVEDALAGHKLTDNIGLQRRTTGVLKAYKAGYLAGKRGLGDVGAREG